MKQIHHSTADWLYKNLTTGEDYTLWQLYTTWYISPPSSLNLRPSPIIQEIYATSKHPSCLNLREGRIITWVRKGHLTRSNPLVYLGLTSYTTYSARIDLSVGLIDWQKYRITWWFAYDDQNNPSTRVTREHWVDPNWVLDFTQDYDPFSGPTNMIGIGGMSVIVVYLLLYDNTEIWIPST